MSEEKNDLQQLRIEVLEKEWARSLEATDIAVNGARSATYELGRVKKELERVNASYVLACNEAAKERSDHEKTKAVCVSWERSQRLERVRVERLREALRAAKGDFDCRGEVSGQTRDAIEEALAATEVKP